MREEEWEVANSKASIQASNAAPTNISASASEFVYRPISGMAVLSLILSLVSLASFVNFYLLVPAFVVLVLSIWTAVKLDRAKAEYQGQLLAKLAVFLALVATIGAGTAHGISFLAITSSAKNWAEQYLNAVLHDELEAAFLMTVMPYEREANGNDPKRIVAQFNEKFQEFKTDDVVRFLRAESSHRPEIEFLKTTGFGRVEGLDLVGLRYLIQLDDDARTAYHVDLNVHGGVHSAWAGRQWYITPNSSIVKLSSQTKADE